MSGCFAFGFRRRVKLDPEPCFALSGWVAGHDEPRVVMVGVGACGPEEFFGGVLISKLGL